MASTRKGLIILERQAAASTGGVGATTALWGPDFGNPPENQVGVHATLPALALDSTDILIGTHVAMPAVSLDSTDLSVGAHTAMPALSLATTDTQVGAHTVIAELAAVSQFDANVGTKAAMPTVAPSGVSRVGVAVRMPALALDAPTDLAVGVDTTSLTWQIPVYHSNQEVWWDELAACVGTTNHPDEDLRIDGVAVTRKDALWKWDFFNFDSSATVTSASLRVQVTQAPALAATCNLHQIANTTEDWDENTQDCGINPAAGANNQNFAVPAATGIITVVLNNAWLTRISTRFGASPNLDGNCSMYAQSNLGNGEFRFEGNNVSTNRPKLIDLTWTTPV